MSVRLNGSDLKIQKTDIWGELNVFNQCRKYNFKLFECPTFLFAVIGFITIIAMAGVYFAAYEKESPETVIILVSFIAVIIFGVGNIIVKSVEKIASANQTKTEFVNIASHQLKAPLTGIRWTTNLLLSSAGADSLKEEQINYIKIIEMENGRMIRLVNDLLNVARIESGKIEIRPQGVNLGDIVEKTIKEITTVAKANNTKIIFNKENDLPYVFADPAYLQIVVENLINNAVKYIKNERGEINITLKKRGKCVEFAIKDNGVGIPLHQQEKIFDKFFRSDNVMKHQTEGTGLGLFIAKAIIDSSRGKIGFNSEEGQGTIFWFTVPAENIKKV